VYAAGFEYRIRNLDEKKLNMQEKVKVEKPGLFQLQIFYYQPEMRYCKVKVEKPGPRTALLVQKCLLY
jgi:hypothetical protein